MDVPTAGKTELLYKAELLLLTIIQNNNLLFHLQQIYEAVWI